MAILAVLWTRSAFAEKPDCAEVTVDADVWATARWPTLPKDVQRAFGARDDIDRCARIVLTRRGAFVSAQVVLPDGRSAARAVSRREEVIPTLEALLLVPQRSAQTPAVEGPASEPLPASSASMPPLEAPPPSVQEVPPPVAVDAAERDAPAASPARSPGHLRIELSAATGARVGDGQAGVGVGAFSFLDLSGWLVGFEGRADRYRTLSGATPDAGVLELAILGGRRFDFGSTALDWVAGLAEVLQGTTTFASQSSPTGTGVSGSSSSAVPRLLVGTRLSFSALSTLHTFVGLDGELGPSRAGDGAALPVVPRVPIWTLGLALGAAVGTP